MGSFLGQLGKGLVKSAVNQVGREGGRRISNQIYNNTTTYSANSDANYTTSQNTIPSDAIIATKEFSVWKIIFLMLIAFCAFPLGSIGVFIYGLSKYKSNTMKVIWHESHAQYASDRRYKTGQRYVGQAIIAKSATVPADDYGKSINKTNGRTAMCIAGAMAILMAVVLLTTLN